MSLTFDPRFFQNLNLKVKYIPSIKPLSLAEEKIQGFLKSSSESSVEELHSLHQILSNSEYGERATTSYMLFADPNQIDADEIYREYLENQKAVTKSIDLLIKSCKDMQSQLLSTEAVETVVQVLLKRNELLVQNIARFSPDRLQAQMRKMVNLLPATQNPNFENWSKVLDRFSERMHKNSRYYKKSKPLINVFEQYRTKALEILKRVKDYRMHQFALPKNEPPSPTAKKLR